MQNIFVLSLVPPARGPRRARRVGVSALLVAAFLSSTVLQGGTPSGSSREATAESALTAEIDRLFARWNSTDLPGCTVGISRAGERVVNRAYGMANLEYRIANQPDTVFEIASVSKQFTAAAVLLLAQQGKLSLEDPVQRYLPEVPDYGEPITIRHLLTHTSGLRDWGFVQDIAGWPRNSRAYTHDHVLDIVSRQRALNFAPGAAFAYNNTGYNLAAVLVGRVAGISFADFTRREIFEPLAMSSTSWRDDYTRVVLQRAVAYHVAEDGVRMNMPFDDVDGDSGLLTTTGDLLKWAANLTDARVGGRAFVQTQLTPGRLASGDELVYTLGGLNRVTWRGVREWNHTGGIAAYRSWFAHYPDHDVSVAVLCNASDARPWEIGRQAVAMFLPVDEPSAPMSVPAERVRDVEGLYRHRQRHGTVSIDYVDDQWHLAGVGVLTPLTVDHFRVGTGTIRIDVERTSTNSVQGIRVTTAGESVGYDRVERSRPTAADLQAFAGTYRSDEVDVELTVAIEDERLVLRRRPNTRIPLQPTYTDGFRGFMWRAFPPLPEVDVRFLRDGSGTVNGLSFSHDRIWDLRFARDDGRSVRE